MTLVERIIPVEKLKTLPLDYQKRAGFVIAISIFLIFFFLINGTARLISTQNIVFFSFSIAISLLLLSTWIFLRKLQFVLASSIILGAIFFMVTSVGFSYDFEHYLEIYRVVTYGLSLIVVGCLIAFHPLQVVVVTVCSMVGFNLVFFIRTYPMAMASETTLTASLWNSFVAVNMAYIMIGIISFFLLRFFDEILKIANEEKEKNRRKFEQLKELIDSSQDGFQIGEHLTSSAMHTLARIRSINEELGQITEKVGNLDQQTDESESINRDLKGHTEVVDTSVMDESSAIEETSSAIVEITATIKNIDRLSRTKQDSIESLRREVRSKEKVVEESTHTMREVLDSTAKLNEIVQIIEDIGERTNTLAINASIEAAHAGNSGLGFGVVAQEIRKLALATNAQTAEITQTLLKNNNLISRAEETNSEINATFQVLIGEINDLALAIEEIINGISEISTGIDEISSASNNLIDLSEKTRDASLAMQNGFGREYEIMKDISRLSSEISRSTGEIKVSFQEIGSDMDRITAMGQENKVHIQNLSEGIEEVSKD